MIIFKKALCIIAFVLGGFSSAFAQPESSADASARTLTVTYGIWLLGLPLGNAEIKNDLRGKNYTVSMQAKLTGLAGLVTGGRGFARSEGMIKASQASPASFSITSVSGADQRNVKMAFKDRNVTSVLVSPPIDAKLDRVAVQDTHKQNVIDPVSAFLMPIIDHVPARDPRQCNRTLQIFDGAARFDVVLSYKETKALNKPGYQGIVLVCQARYVPVSGHRAQKPATKFMVENRDLFVWLAPFEADKVLMPLKVSVKTMIGTSIIEANRISQ